jgi:hypothetical protein
MSSLSQLNKELAVKVYLKTLTCRVIAEKSQPEPGSEALRFLTLQYFDMKLGHIKDLMRSLWK